MQLRISICLLLAGITLAIYWPAGHFDAVYIDDPLFVMSTEVAEGLNWHGLAWAMTGVVASNWHPITTLSFLITRSFWGYNPGAEHLVNIFFHAANAALLFLMLFRLTAATWRSAIVAGIFAWHPLRVESVAWIAERKDVFFMFFMLLSLYCYAGYAKAKTEGTAAGRSPRRNYILALLFFVLSLLSKATVVTLPFLLLLLDFWPLQRLNRATLRALLVEKIPFFILMVVFCGLTFWVHEAHADVRTLQNLSVANRMGNVILSYINYLGKLVWPSDLAVVYPFPESFDNVEVILAALLLLAVSALCILERSRRPYLAVGWFWYLGTMVPVIGLVQIGWQSMADRHTYLTMIGPVMAITWLVSEWAASRAVFKYLAGLAAAAVLGACILLTRTQLAYWKDTVTLFERTVAVTGDNFLAQMDLATGLEMQKNFREAAVHYRMALAIAPFENMIHYQLGACLGMAGYTRAGLEEYQMAAEDGGWRPDDYTQNMALANALTLLGHPDEAVPFLEAALSEKPDSVNALNDLAWDLATNPDENIRNGARAVQLAERACELTDYKQTIVMGTLAAAYAEAGRFDDAVAMAQKAIANAQQNGETILAKKNQELLQLYKAHQAYHEAPGSN